MKVYTQLNFGGNCEEAFRFYERNLGGKVLMMMRQDQAPGNATGDAGTAIIHARLGIGDTVLIGNDVPPSVFEKIRSVYIYLSVDSREEAERVYKLLAKDGQVYIQLGETFLRLALASCVIGLVCRGRSSMSARWHRIFQDFFLRGSTRITGSARLCDCLHRDAIPGMRRLRRRSEARRSTGFRTGRVVNRQCTF